MCCHPGLKVRLNNRRAFSSNSVRGTRKTVFSIVKGKQISQSPINSNFSPSRPVSGRYYTCSHHIHFWVQSILPESRSPNYPGRSPVFHILNRCHPEWRLKETLSSLTCHGTLGRCVAPCECRGMHEWSLGHAAQREGQRGRRGIATAVWTRALTHTSRYFCHWGEWTE